MDLFFVLSGFLVGGLLVAERQSMRRIDVKRFLVRRALRIWPAYYAFLAVAAVAAWRFGTPARTFLPYVVHLQNYLEDGRFAQHCWSLAVEEHFYLALPLALPVFFPARHVGRSALCVLALAATCAYLRAASDAGAPARQTHLRADTLAIGVLLAQLYYERRETFDLIFPHRIGLAAAGLTVVITAVLWPIAAGPASKAFVPLLLALGYGAIIAAAVAAPRGSWDRLLVARTLGFVGIYSYSIYLWHIEAAYAITATLWKSAVATAIPKWANWPLGMFCYVAFAVGIGVLMGRCIEEQFMLLRDKWCPRPGPSTAIPHAIPSASAYHSGVLPPRDANRANAIICTYSTNTTSRASEGPA